MNQNYCIIGDLHGRIDALNKILDHSPNYHFVFLGDIIHHKPFFKKTNRTSPIRMLQRVKSLVDSGISTLILGNNENYVLKNLVLPKNQIKKKEVKYTLQCLKSLELEDRLSILRWLNTSPLTLEFESYGKTYRCAHAYYSTDHETNSRMRHTVLTGPGYPWFRQDDLDEHISLDPKYQYFFGHYGYPYFRKNLHILDATNFEGVGVYYTDREEFIVYY